MKFTCYGHPQLKATHSTTLEFTKDAELTSNGDCIIGVRCTFNSSDIKKWIASLKEWDAIYGKIKVGKDCSSFSARVNKHFSDTHEIVFRKSNFTSERTLGILCDKSAADITRKIKEKMKDENQVMEVEIIGKKTTQ